MSNKKTQKIETLEQALEVSAQLEKDIVALRAEYDEKLNQSAEELQSVVDELEALKSESSEITKVVPGTFKSKAHGVTIRFRKGFMQTRVKGSLVSSAEIIKNKNGAFTEFLDNLIEIGYGGIEIVKK